MHRTELLKQWQERLQALLGPGGDVIGTIGGGKAKPTGKIDIATMQPLSRKGEVNALVQTVFIACRSAHGSFDHTVSPR